MIEMLVFIVQWIWFVGLAHHLLTFVESRRARSLSPFERLLTVSVGLGVAGYLLFWLYALAWPIGWALSFGSFFLGLHGAYRFLRSHNQNDWGNAESWAWCCGFIGLLGLLYLSFVSLVHYRPENLLDWISNYYFDLSNDNVIPRFAAETVRRGGQIIDPAAAWQMSDRTPLLGGIYLLFSFFTDTKTYQATGLIFQTLFFLSALVFLQPFGLSGRTRFWVLIGLVFSGFFHHSSIYLWPKLQSAHFVLLGFLLMTETELSPLSEEGRWGAAGLCFVLAYLSHPGVIFCAPILLPFAIFQLSRLRQQHARVLVPLLPAALLFAIWIFYQKIIDPPGDRLLKWHLTGVTEMNRVPLAKLLRDSYSKLSWAEILDARWQNLKFQFGIESGIASLRDWRKSEFLHTFQGFGLWWLGLLGLPSLFRKSPRASAVKWIFAGILVAQIFWIAVIFLPDATPNHHNSYATLGFIALVLWIGLAQISSALVATVSCLSSAYFLLIWIAGTPRDYLVAGKTLNLWDIPVIVALLAAFITYCWRALGREDQLRSRTAATIS